MAHDARARIIENPFYVLELTTDRGRIDVERAGAKLLGMLELGLAAAARYRTPLGEVERTADLVRRAMAELRDPARRALHELWAALPANEAIAEGAEDELPPPFPGALAVFGFGR